MILGEAKILIEDTSFTAATVAIGAFIVLKAPTVVTGIIDG